MFRYVSFRIKILRCQNDTNIVSLTQKMEQEIIFFQIVLNAELFRQLKYTSV